MKSLAICMGLAFLGCVATASRPAPVTTNHAPSQVNPQTFETEGSDPTVVLRAADNSNFGTGVVVAQNKERALILTVNHLFAPGYSIETLVIEQRSPTRPTTILFPFSGQKTVKVDATLDLALIETPPIWPGIANVLLEADLPGLAPYTYCYVFGFPSSGGWPTETPHMTSGWISQYSGRQRMRFSADLMFGNSGSGIWVVIRGRLTLVAVFHSIYTVDGTRRTPIFHLVEGTEPAKMLEFLKISD